MNKIYNYFEIDGLLHIICSNLLVSILKHIVDIDIAVVITIVIFLSKEFIYDKLLNKGHCSKKDIISDFIGLFIGII